MTGKVEKAGVYFAVAAALLLLLGLTIVLAFIDLGPFNVVVALAIAVVKASLVILFFMHVRSGTQVIRVIALAGLAWLMIMFLLTMSDFLTRS